ncbi:hypothetical protein GJ496_001625 [Pomphorhynchus laevis]|nr:hypothetical protein GJ496_001625 [Pomphorhynchus laevis]
MYKDAYKELEESSIALYKIFVFCQLILQRPESKKTSVLRKTLEKRLNLWKNDKFNDLLNEVQVLQNRSFLQKKQPNIQSNLSRRFINLYKGGRVSTAMRVLR